MRPAPTLRLPASLLVLATVAVTFWIGGRVAEGQLSALRAGVDDANIYFRYARNIAHGFGYVWNPGGERVEGGTSILWLATCTAAFEVTDTPERALFLISAGLAALSAWIVASRLARIVDPAGGAVATLVTGLIVACWIAASPAHVVWMTATLMDTAAWTFALVLAWSAGISWTENPGLLSRRLAFGLALALVVVGRPEGPLAGAALLAGAAISARRRAGIGEVVRSLILPAGMFVATFAAVMLLRKAYFGYWLPNTYYAKVDADLSFRIESGLSYAVSSIVAWPAACAAAVLASAALVFRPGGAPATLAIAILLCFLFGAIYEGGDHFGAWRLFQPGWVLMLVPIVTVLVRIVPESRRLGWIAGILLVLAGTTMLVGPVAWTRLRETTGLRISFSLVGHGRPVAETFNEIFHEDPRPVVGVVAGGAFPLVYHRKCFDLLGINDVEMAHASVSRRGRIHGHAAFHAPTFFRRAPHFLIGLMRLLPADDPGPPEERIPFADLSQEDARHFDELYAPVAIATPAIYAQGVMLPAWARRDWLEENAGRFPVRELVPTSSGWTYKSR